MRDRTVKLVLDEDQLGQLQATALGASRPTVLEQLAHLAQVGWLVVAAAVAAYGYLEFGRPLQQADLMSRNAAPVDLKTSLAIGKAKRGIYEVTLSGSLTSRAKLPVNVLYSAISIYVGQADGLTSEAKDKGVVLVNPPGQDGPVVWRLVGREVGVLSSRLPELSSVLQGKFPNARLLPGEAGVSYLEEGSSSRFASNYFIKLSGDCFVGYQIECCHESAAGTQVTTSSYGLAPVED